MPVIDIRVPNQYLTKAKKEQLENDLNKIVLNLDKKFNIQNRGDGYKTELMKVNENAGIAPVKVSEEVIKILKKQSKPQNFRYVSLVIIRHYLIQRLPQCGIYGILQIIIMMN